MTMTSVYRAALLTGSAVAVYVWPVTAILPTIAGLLALIEYLATRRLGSE